MYGFGRGAAASDRDADQGDLCAATRMTRWWQRPNSGGRWLMRVVGNAQNIPVLNDLPAGCQCRQDLVLALD
jgi:hypothetical protein